MGTITHAQKRRVDVRTRVDELHVSGRAINAEFSTNFVLDNISETGMGVWTAVPLVEGTIIDLTTDSGEIMRAKVVWCSRTSTDLGFLNGLESDENCQIHKKTYQNVTRQLLDYALCC